METNKSIISLAAALMTFTAVASSLNEARTPIHRPLIEEYTGTWCGWCVRGIVGMELLRETYGDDFIGVAYHNDDAMEIMSSNKFPNNIYGYPSAFIERTSEVDPLYGYSNTTTGAIVAAMEQFAALEAIAGIDVKARWTSAEKTAISVDINSYFTIDDESGKYAIEVMLIADDLYGSGSGWNQSNYYSGYSYYTNDPYLGEWVQKPLTVMNYHFNDVLIGASGVISGSLPSSIVAYEDYSFNYTITLSSLPKPALIQNKDNLHVIAVVVNKNNRKAINANRAYINDYKAAIPGDVDDDSSITIDDVTLLIDYLLSDDSTLINIANADVDGDGLVNINDVTEIIELLLGI